MTRHFRHLTAALVLLLSLLLLCGCQNKEAQYFLPDVPAESGFAWKDALLKAVNADYEKHGYNQSEHYVRDTALDTSAELALNHLRSVSGNNMDKATQLLLEESDDGSIPCFAALKKQLDLDSSKTYWVHYAVLDANTLEGNALREGVALDDTANALNNNQGCICFGDSNPEQNAEIVGFAAGVIGDKALLIMLSVS